MNQYKKQAFTLVELIVVITILAILGTIAFISLQGYSKDARDATRMSDISSIRSGLELFITTTGIYPNPSSGTEITYSGSEIWTQGTVGDTVITNLNKLNKLPTDPLTGSEYTYSRLNTKKEYELGAIVEGDLAYNPIILQANAADNIRSYVKGTYNGSVAKVLTGTTEYVLAVPTIISSDVSESDLLDIISKQALSFNGYDNIPSSYEGYTSTGGFDFSSSTPTNIVVYEGDTSDLNISSELKIFTENLQTVYAGTSIENTGIYKEILLVDTTNDEEVLALVGVMIDESLGGSVVENYLSNGSCGSDHGKNLMNTPVNLCNSGTASEVEDNGIGSTYEWTCDGSNGGEVTSCSANHIDNPFTFDPGTGTITDYNPAIGGTDVIIPSTIDGVAVTTIGTSAFRSNGLTSVVIPDSVTSIGSNSFEHNSLTSLTIPSSITSIPNYAFNYNSLTSVVLPNGVTTIGYQSFGSNRLTSLTLPNTITSIASYAFYYQEGGVGTVYGPASGYVFDTYLNNTSSQFDKLDLKGYRYTCTVDTCTGAYMLDETIGSIVDYDPVIGGTDVVIPSTIDGITITAIGSAAFNSNGLTSVTIPSGITSIGTSAFRSNGLTSIIIPDSVTSIGTNAFEHNSLTDVTIPGSVTSIGNYAFNYNSLTSVVIPNGVTTIGYQSFGSNRLTSLTLPNTITSIASYAFYYQEGGMGTVYGPASGYVFDTYLNNTSSQFDKLDLKGYRYTCTIDTCTGAYMLDETIGSIVDYDPVIGGTDVVIPSTIDGITVTAIGSAAFNSNGLTSVTIPSGVTSIGTSAFRSNGLTSIIIPSTVTNIDGNAFEYNSLTGVTIPGSVTSIGNYAFKNNSLTDVIISSGVTTIGYQSFASNSLRNVTLPNTITSIVSYAFDFQEGGPGGTVYGPASGYVFDTYTSNSSSQFDKYELNNYVGN